MGSTFHFKDESAPGIVSDGKKIFISLDGENTIMLENFFVTSFSIDLGCEPNYIDDASIWNGFRQSGEVHLTLDLVGSKALFTEAEDLDYKFAMDMTVRQLLEAVSDKLKQREESKGD